MDKIPIYDASDNDHLRHAAASCGLVVKGEDYHYPSFSPLQITELLGRGKTIITGKEEHHKCSFTRWMTNDNGMIYRQDFVHKYHTSNLLVYHFAKFTDWAPLQASKQVFKPLNVTYEAKNGLVMIVPFIAGRHENNMKEPHELVWLWLRRRMIELKAKPEDKYKHIYTLAMPGGRNGRLTSSWSERALIGSIVIDRQGSNELKISDCLSPE